MTNKQYIDNFTRKHDIEVDNYNRDSFIIFNDFYFFKLEEIKHDIDTNQPPRQLLDWYEQNLEPSEVKVSYEDLVKGKADVICCAD